MLISSKTFRGRIPELPTHPRSLRKSRPVAGRDPTGIEYPPAFLMMRGFDRGERRKESQND